MDLGSGSTVQYNIIVTFGLLCCPVGNSFISCATDKRWGVWRAAVLSLHSCGSRQEWQIRGRARVMLTVHCSGGWHGVRGHEVG